MLCVGVAILLAICAGVVYAPSGFTPCSGGDCVTYDQSFPTACVERANQPPTNNCGWHSSLDPRLDERILGGKVIAYKIKWSSGWSGWFVPGYTDQDSKFNIQPKNCPYYFKGNSMRRMWSYFTDHYHTYIICGDESKFI